MARRPRPATRRVPLLRSPPGPSWRSSPRGDRPSRRAPRRRRRILPRRRRARRVPPPRRLDDASRPRPRGGPDVTPGRTSRPCGARAVRERARVPSGGRLGGLDRSLVADAFKRVPIKSRVCPVSQKIASSAFRYQAANFSTRRSRAFDKSRKSPPRSPSIQRTRTVHGLATANMAKGASRSPSSPRLPRVATDARRSTPPPAPLADARAAEN